MDGPIAGHPPGLNPVVGALRAVRFVIIRGNIKELGELRLCRLNLAEFICAARLEHALLSFPLPVHAKSRVSHRMHRPANLGFFPGLAPIGRYFHLPNRTPAGPSQAGDLVETMTWQPLSPEGKVITDLGPTGRSARQFSDRWRCTHNRCKSCNTGPRLDSPQPLGVIDPLKAWNEQSRGKPC